MHLPRPALTGSLLGALFCTAPLPSPATPPAPAARPALLVFITVDQMREDYLDRWKSQFTGGFKRLLDGGALFTNGHQDHAITETAPGHASTMSGRFPRSTGITRNLAGVNDTGSKVIGSANLGASPFRFRGTTLTDWLTAANARTQALSVSYKDRGAILPIGRSKQSVYWWGGRTYTTSTWYRDSLPDWVKAFNARQIPANNAGKVWDLLLPASAYAEPDSVPVESSGRRFTFPYPLSANGDTATFQYPTFPFMDDLSAQFALAGVQALELGKGPETDVLAVSFSATDLIGHRFGPDSREVHDQVVRLDRIIGGFIDSLYQLRDSSRIVFALTGDHGVQPFPELNNGRITPAPMRVDVHPAVVAAQRVILAAGGDPNKMDLESGAFVMDRDSIKVKPAVLKAAVDSFVATARRIPGVLRADRFTDLAKANMGTDYIARRWVQMFPPDVPVDAVITLTEGSYWSTYPVAQHGTPHMQDSHVPILFYGPPFKPGRYPGFVRTVDMAPTLAQVLGVTPGEPLDGHVLTVAIK
jgi:predicted AlkP superfamily pyrophosphatase or phosphodiesterase